MSDKPERAVVFILKVEADSEKDLVNALHDLATQISVDGLSLTCISGGYSFSYVYNSERNNITHDEYFRQINEMLEKTKDGHSDS